MENYIVLHERQSDICVSNIGLKFVWRIQWHVFGGRSLELLHSNRIIPRRKIPRMILTVDMHETLVTKMVSKADTVKLVSNEALFGDGHTDVLKKSCA